ncbi:hypothetical protein QOZ80_9AG0682100 [Eleusine coracana subsp. coracana]|nr:hypothetical protein QOZ80_9AG0682100 [Eleusine coracana subsp. coracana]
MRNIYAAHRFPPKRRVTVFPKHYLPFTKTKRARRERGKRDRGRRRRRQILRVLAEVYPAEVRGQREDQRDDSYPSIPLLDLRYLHLRERDRERAAARNPKNKGSQDGLTPEQRRERDKKALEEKAAKKAQQAAGASSGGGTSTDSKNKGGKK